MNILKWFSFNRGKIQNRSLGVFDLINFLQDEKSFNQLKQNGYTVLNFINNQEVKSLKDNLLIYIDKVNVEDTFYTSGRDEMVNRTLAKELTWPIIEPILHRIIDNEKVDTIGCAWLLKPVGIKSSLSPHQDSSLIDETQFPAFYGWVALQDTTIENGCMHVIPGSHLWGNHYRSLDVPWAFEKYTDLLLEYSQPIEMKAGEILLFDTALIHGSYPNNSKNLRAALNLFFKPKNAEMMHYARFDDTPKGKIESYKIDSDFFLNEDYRKRPEDTTKYPFFGYVDQIDLKLSEKKIRKWCTQNK
jgi:hypothetical protein